MSDQNLPYQNLAENNNKDKKNDKDNKVHRKAPLALALMHYPTFDRQKNIVATNLMKEAS